MSSNLSYPILSIYLSIELMNQSENLGGHFCWNGLATAELETPFLGYGSKHLFILVNIKIVEGEWRKSSSKHSRTGFRIKTHVSPVIIVVESIRIKTCRVGRQTTWAGNRVRTSSVGTQEFSKPDPLEHHLAARKGCASHPDPHLKLHAAISKNIRQTWMIFQFKT